MSILSQRVVTTFPLHIESRFQFLPTEILLDPFSFALPQFGGGSFVGLLSLPVAMVGEVTMIGSVVGELSTGATMGGEPEGGFVISGTVQLAMGGEALIVAADEGLVVGPLSLSAVMVGEVSLILWGDDPLMWGDDLIIWD